MIAVLFDGQLPKAVFFDLDGTLIDSVPDLAVAIDRMLADLGYRQAGESKVREWVGNGARMLVQRALFDACQQTDDQQTEKAHQLFLQYYSEHSFRYSMVYVGVKRVLGELRRQGVRMAVVTNKPGQFTPDILANYGLTRYFEVVLSGDSLSQKKPDPAPLLHLMQLMHLGQDECLMVGDSRSDIAAANAAGIRSVCVTYGYNHGENPRHLPATAHIDHFLELLG